MASWFPKFYYSADEIAAMMLQLETAWSSFASDIAKQTDVFDADELEQFEMLDESYAKWKKGLGLWDKYAGSTATAVQLFAKQLKYWTDIFNARTGGKLSAVDTSLTTTTPEDTSPLFAVNIGPGGELISKETTDRLQTVVVAVCIAVGLSAIAKTIRG